ncbi:serine hydroxymethyltransferase [Achromobacter sp. HZ01]|uniref:serine hydroxymethyltransferase n=1 Tax=Achromobacter sp. HZ01 TaxID=1416886 RepID=UPI000DC3151F|nr:serine hydroxymethyltransferase [Achromobacter sp. HZ01]RAP63229.1 serine hydroxymethyltransferase [Achromobacter sp. HZ01]
MTDLSISEGMAPAGVSALPLQQADPELWRAVDAERLRQRRSIELIASENFVSRAVLEIQGSVLTNKYAEGYPGRRYYGGCVNVDVAERLAIERAQRLFGARHANVQPHSGSQANQAVYLALLAPGDKILGLDLKAGGHLTHGAQVNLSGRWFQAVSYGVDPHSQRVDMDEVARIARRERPRLIVAGGSAYARTYDFARFRAIADEVGAFFMADMAHFAGLVAGGVYPTPVPHAHVTTTTTHKTLRGPRGGMILSNDDEIARKIDSAVFPGLQGGPLMHVVAAKAVALGEALQPSFRAYVRAVVENAQALCARLSQGGLSIVSGGTDCHLGVVDLRPWGLAGNVAEQALERVGITLNKNAVPHDTARPAVTSGIRVGSAACTSRGMGPDAFQEIGDMMLALLGALRAGAVDRRGEDAIREGVAALVERYPLPY